MVVAAVVASTVAVAADMAAADTGKRSSTDSYLLTHEKAAAGFIPAAAFLW
jgi:hypothetical protein